MPDTFEAFLRAVYNEECMGLGLSAEDYEYSVQWILHQEGKQ